MAIRIANQVCRLNYFDQSLITRHERTNFIIREHIAHRAVGVRKKELNIRRAGYSLFELANGTRQALPTVATMSRPAMAVVRFDSHCADILMCGRVQRALDADGLPIRRQRVPVEARFARVA